MHERLERPSRPGTVKSSIALVTLAAFFVTGCAAKMPPPPRVIPPPQFRPIQSGIVLTPGVVIAAEDGSFRLREGEVFQPPFNQGDGCLLDPKAEAPGDGERSGARRVRVTVPGLSEPLYGLLSLCGAPAGASGAAAQRYTLEVPAGRVDATAGGLVSAVWEDHLDSKGAAIGTKSWILWLARTPFPPPAGDGPLRTAATAHAEAVAREQQAYEARVEAAKKKQRGTIIQALLILGLVGLLAWTVEQDA